MEEEHWMQISKPCKKTKFKGGAFQIGSKLYLNVEELTPGMKRSLLARCRYCGDLLNHGYCPNAKCKSNRDKKK